MAEEKEEEEERVSSSWRRLSWPGRRPFYEANNSFWLSPLDRTRFVLTLVNLCVSLLNFATWRTFCRTHTRTHKEAQWTHTVSARNNWPSVRPLRTLQIRAENQLNCRCGGLNISANTRPGQVNKNIVKSEKEGSRKDEEEEELLLLLLLRLQSRQLDYSVAFYTHDWMRNLCGVIYENKNRKQYFCLHCECERRTEREGGRGNQCLSIEAESVRAVRPLCSHTHSHAVTVIYARAGRVASVQQRHRRRRPCGWRSTHPINNGQVLGQQMWHTDSAFASLFVLAHTHTHTHL